MLISNGITEQPSFGSFVIDSDACRHAGNWPLGKTIPPLSRARGRSGPHLLFEFERRRIQRDGGQADRRKEWNAYTQLRDIRCILISAIRSLGRPIDPIELFRRYELLAAACCDAVPLDPRREEKLAESTLQKRRTAAYLFAQIMEDYVGIPYEEWEQRFRVALVKHCERLPRMLRFCSGRRGRIQKFTPTLDGLNRLILVASQQEDSLKRTRDVAFLMMLSSTGLRISSAVEIDGSWFYRVGSGVRLATFEKRKDEWQQILLSPEVVKALEAYVNCRDHRFGRTGGLYSAGPFWLASSGGRWKTNAATRMIRDLSSLVLPQCIGPHRIRAATTQELTRYLSRETIAEARGWHSVKILDNHYGPPPGIRLQPKRGKPGAPNSELQAIADSRARRSIERAKATGARRIRRAKDKPIAVGKI